MALFVHNTRTRKKEAFVPAQPKVVRIYSCGLTVYAPMHIGHARTYCFWDFFRRYLEYRGYHVVSVINYTDVDDRIIDRSGTRGCLDLAEEMIARFRMDCRDLHLKDYAVYTRATDFVAEQVDMIKALVDRGHAYIVEGEVFYDVTSFENYGALSGRSLEDQEVGASGRVGEDVTRKRNPADFTLWKPPVEGQPCWETGQAAWPSGRPGWHIECSAMSTTLLGNHFDVHGGAIDNMFPHHENEIAQSEPLCGHPWVRYWLHPEHLDLRGEKMSKSLGNVVGVPELLGEHSYDVVRWFFASHHYRKKLAYSSELIGASAAGYERILRMLRSLGERLSGCDLPPSAESTRYPSEAGQGALVPRWRYKYEMGRFGQHTRLFIDRFVEALDDDLNTPEAVAALFDYVAQLYQDGIDGEQAVEHLLPVYRALAHHLHVLGVEEADPTLFPELVADYAVPPPKGLTDRGADRAVERLIALRGEARKAKDFDKADALRDLMQEAGIVVEDQGGGQARWHVT
ncbi:MAG: cysteine--tRNA ligase [Myxococcales bacterium]|nr:cysteine--tRNA ligase [Myxococcales bacterium]MDD9966571.1 cysteine--tRNA ligase [Myxococcales bacterium]